MQTYIVVGKRESRDAFMQDYLIEERILSHNILRYDTSIKIHDVHAIISAASISVGEHEKRLFILSGTFTVPAQNALLKFLEELAPSDVVMLAVDTKDMLLDTIVSRCSIISLKPPSDQLSELNQDDEAPFHGDFDTEHMLRIAERYPDYNDCITSLRKFIVIRAKSDGQIPPNAVRVLKKLHKRYRFVLENNVNARFSIESARFGEI